MVRIRVPVEHVALYSDFVNEVTRSRGIRVKANFSYIGKRPYHHGVLLDIHEWRIEGVDPEGTLHNLLLETANYSLRMMADSIHEARDYRRYVPAFKLWRDHGG